jgi:hypothetical protein
METIMPYLSVAAGALLGVAAHVIKKVVTQREHDKTFSLPKYLSENPYRVIMTVFYAAAGVAGLIAAGDVSFYTALVTGFAANSLSGASDK